MVGGYLFPLFFSGETLWRWGCPKSCLIPSASAQEGLLPWPPRDRHADHQQPKFHPVLASDQEKRIQWINRPARALQSPRPPHLTPTGAQDQENTIYFKPRDTVSFNPPLCNQGGKCFSFGANEMKTWATYKSQSKHHFRRQRILQLIFSPLNLDVAHTHH